MSYYDLQPWQSPARQASWEQPPPPSRSGASSTSQREEPTAFRLQIEEVDRALENINKSGKPFNMPPRRDSISMMPRQYSDYNPRMGPPPQRHHSVSEFDPMRSPSAGSNLQNFYANQRFQPRHTEAEQMQQAKRRMAAQRERELRNYHQEQQYNRKISAQGKPDRAISPNAMNEEERRELIARQHRALYGNDSASFFSIGFGNDDKALRSSTQAQSLPGSAAVPRDGSPLTYNAFGMPLDTSSNQYSSTDPNMPPKGSSPKTQQQQQQQQQSVQQSRSRANSTASPISNAQNYNSLFDNAAMQSSRTSTSSPGDSPPHPGKTAGVAPIGTRPSALQQSQQQQQQQQQQQGQATNTGLNKRSTTPLPSPLSYSFAASSSANAENSGLTATSASMNERSTSAASNANPTSSTAGGPNKENHVPNWGSSSGVWGKNSLGMQASVWG
ncbi:hypothetical protein MMC25_001275 [Agyrium rufum]|nr:hypothetical protein [Agyrium rufum]